VSEETKVQLRAMRAAFDPMDLAADVGLRLGKIFSIVERIEEDRQEEMARAGEIPPQPPQRPCGKPCQTHPKEPKPTQALGVIYHWRNKGNWLELLGWWMSSIISRSWARVWCLE